MAFISNGGTEFLAISIKNKLKVFKNRVLYISHINNTVEKKEGDKQQGGGDGGFICHAFSSDKVFFAALTEDKKFLVWEVSQVEGNLVMTLEFPKRPTSFCFLNKEKAVMVSDKYGDVFKCAITAATPSPPSLVLGHLSMVLDVKVTENDQFIISADRDEKIRVSLYPNAYSIHTYCLGHKNLVSCIKTLKNNQLLSSSADRTVRLWNYEKGTELSSIDLKEHIGQGVPAQLVVQENNVVLIAEKVQKVLFLEICDETTLRYKSSYGLDSQPISICSTTVGDVYVLSTSRTKPVVVLSNDGKEYKEKDIDESINKEINEWIQDLPSEITYLTGLVKPVRGKRDASALITPEATINFEGVYNESNSKIQKIDEENKMEE